MRFWISHGWPVSCLPHQLHKRHIGVGYKGNFVLVLGEVIEDQPEGEGFAQTDISYNDGYAFVAFLYGE